MGSKFFDSFETKANVLKRSTTRWADEGSHPDRPTSLSYEHSKVRIQEHNADSEDDNVESPRARPISNLSLLANKTGSSSGSSVFANRPIASLLRPTSQKETKAPTFKPGVLVTRPKALEPQPLSQDLSSVVTKLSSMESRITSLLESRLTSLEKKIEASEKRVYMLEGRISSTTKAVENVGAIVEGHIAAGLKITRDDMIQIMELINDCTKESNNILVSHIEKVADKISDTHTPAAPNSEEEDLNIGDDEVIVITANNPHDMIHKTSIEELTTVVGNSTIYVCSSVQEFKRDFRIIREADSATDLAAPLSDAAEEA